MKKKILMLIIILSTFVIPQHFTEAKVTKSKDYVKLAVQTGIHSKYKHEITIYSKFFIHKINKKKLKDTLTSKPITDAYLTQMSNGEINKYLIDKNLNLIDVKTKKLYTLSDKTKGKVDKYLHTLRKKHYGKLLPWEKVNLLIPRFSKFEIIDLDSGARFQVQRRAGSKHADVQPLTRKDTEIMKKVYSGKWSWKRRAILINLDNKLIAASMHGMPHGQGAIINGFPGHFCVHFYLSKTHKRNAPDFAHNLMTWKAAGKIDTYFKTITPNNLVDSFLFGIHQKNIQVLKMTTSISQYSEAEKLFRRLDDIQSIKRISNFSENKLEDDHSLFMAIPIEVRLIKNNTFEKTMLTFFIYRQSVDDPWKLDMNALSIQLHRS